MLGLVLNCKNVWFDYNDTKLARLQYIFRKFRNFLFTSEV